MKSLRLKNRHYYFGGYLDFPSINRAKAESRRLGGAGNVKTIQDKPSAYMVAGLENGDIPQTNSFKRYSGDFCTEMAAILIASQEAVL